MNIFSSFRCFYYLSIPLVNQRLYTTKIGDIFAKDLVDVDTVVKGWIKSARKMKNMVFFDINDGSSFKNLQVAIPKHLVPENMDYGASVELAGKLIKAPSGQIELHPEEMKVIGKCDINEFPFAPRRKYDMEYVRETLHFRPRTKTFSSLLRIRDKASRQIHKYFTKNNFIFIHTPILTSNDCEGAGEVFKIQPNNAECISEMGRKDIKLPDDEIFFRTKTYLTVSGQLHLECFARCLNNVYCFAPSFRAENSKSRLHLSEFYMIEAEMAFANNLEELLKLMENFIQTITIEMLDNFSEEINVYRKLIDLPNTDSLHNIIKNNYGILTYDEAHSILVNNQDQFTHPVTKNHSLTKEQELFLVKHNGNVPVFVVNWPSEVKPFYMKSLDEDRSKVFAVDLLFPNTGELCGGGIREDNYRTLKKKLEQLGLLLQLNWYLELRKFGNVATSGFGMGFERYLQILLGTPNIKDTIPFPRWPYNCKL